MIETLQQPWPWYVAGVLIGLTVPALLLLGNKQFGISSSLRHICAACLPATKPYFQYDWKKEIWNFFFVGGVIVGGVVAVTVLKNPEPLSIAPQTQAELSQLGVASYGELLPTDVFNWSSLFTLRGFVFVVVGGFLVGFGTRYAGGCTSGHAISGLSNFQLASLIATICFMVGGFLATHFLLPLVFKL